MTQDPFGALAQMLLRALSPALRPAPRFIDLMTPDIAFEFPFAPPGLTRSITGRENLAAYLSGLADRITLREVILKEAMLSATGGAAVVEFRAEAVLQPGAALYRQDYVSVLSLREGRIARYRDYWNPLNLPANLRPDAR